MLKKDTTDTAQLMLNLINGVGLTSLLVVKTNGIPVYKFHFCETSLLKSDSILLGSFFSAINSFSNSFLRIISDIVFTSPEGKQEGLFFKYYNNLIFVISLSFEGKILLCSSIKLRELVEMILWQFTTYFYDIFINLCEQKKILDLNNAFKGYDAFFTELIYKGCINFGQNLPLSLSSSFEPSINKPKGCVEEIASMPLKLIVNDFALESIFILTREGDLIGEKHFQKSRMHQEDKITGLTISNYFMALETFARKYILSNLANFGFFYNRLYFERFDIPKAGENYIVLGIFNDIKYYHRSLEETKQIIKAIFRNICNRFTLNDRKITKSVISKVLDLRKSA